MNEKVARANLRLALALLKSRIRFPRIRLREILMAEGLISIGKEVLGQYIQRRLSRRNG
jgi:hypothetical protein